ncbi:MAG TPA: type I DNA topoisomerase [Phycisphaerae bacterium]|nr:type I DNA topoisomerase [Phycisphaerae bacterium]
MMVGRKADGKALVIVESPAKARTINKYLGEKYVVKASMGHVRDLPPREFGIDVSDDFRPTYETVRGRDKVLNDLRKTAAKAPSVYLATDRDREGEAIAWHLVEALSLPPERIRRVIFNEITKSAIAEAFAHPHEIDLDRVNAQQARRILDRIVGYELSPLLWKKIARGLSAGRVQSVTVRLIVEREREIRAFVPQESWKIAAYVLADPAGAERLAKPWADFFGQEHTQKEISQWLREHGGFRAELAEIGGKPFKPDNVEAAQASAEALGYQVDRVARRVWEEYKQLGLQQVELVGKLDPARAPRLVVSELSTKRTTTKPPAPFTTASLQQQASSTLRFSASRTMRIAQSLYEGIDLNGEGPVGLITYMRTDSTNLAAEAIAHVRDLIKQDYGERYLPKEPNVFGKRQARAQEAHEAIRPTDPALTPDRVRHALTDEQFKLYQLVWKRFVACQMPPAEWDSTSVGLTCETALGMARFTGSGRKLVFDGFMKVAGVTSEDQILPHLERYEPVGMLGLEPRQQFTSPPPRYTVASLVRALETDGIGRPSTYAAIIDTIQKRGYVEQEERKFYPTALGELVTDKLVEHFPKIMDVKFTSHMEEELDKIEDAHLDWVHVLHEFYDPFRELLVQAGDRMQATRNEPSEYTCPACDEPMVYRWSKAGRFLACTKYPKCKATLNIDRDGQPVEPKRVDVACEACGKPMVLRRSKTGYFLGCSGYPDCRGTIPCNEDGEPLRLVKEQELTRPCDACGSGTMKVKRQGRRAFLACDRYPQCKNTAQLPSDVRLERKAAPPPQPAGVNCEKCGRPLVFRTGRRGKFISCSGFPKCRNTKPMDKLEELKASAAALGHPGNEPVADSGASGSTGPPPTAMSASRRPALKAPCDVNDDPPVGYAWTRTGRPVVEVMPEEGKLSCPECGGVMQLKRGRFGPFFSCSRFPHCKFVANLRGEAKKQAEDTLPAPPRPKAELTDIACEECGQLMVIREGRRGKFLGCKGYPKCRSTKELPAGVGT